MKLKQIVALAFIALGVLGLIYGSFTYTSETHDADLGVMEFSIDDKETVEIPVWLSVGFIVVGAGLLVFKKR